MHRSGSLLIAHGRRAGCRSLSPAIGRNLSTEAGQDSTQAPSTEGKKPMARRLLSATDLDGISITPASFSEISQPSHGQSPVPASGSPGSSLGAQRQPNSATRSSLSSRLAQKRREASTGPLEQAAQVAVLESKPPNTPNHDSSPTSSRQPGRVHSRWQQASSHSTPSAPSAVQKNVQTSIPLTQNAERGGGPVRGGASRAAVGGFRGGRGYAARPQSESGAAPAAGTPNTDSHFAPFRGRFPSRGAFSPRGAQSGMRGRGTGSGRGRGRGRPKTQSQVPRADSYEFELPGEAEAYSREMQNEKEDPRRWQGQLPMDLVLPEPTNFENLFHTPSPSLRSAGGTIEEGQTPMVVTRSRPRHRASSLKVADYEPYRSTIVELRGETSIRPLDAVDNAKLALSRRSDIKLKQREDALCVVEGFTDEKEVAAQ
ncbi:hypothetical protein BD410DRAFT_790344 [Rickenella mellea]|uniref:Uncharacterized protein n=1 Tax=Rickenella mellea TaxID=50990 RepID=A0A4Y7Q2F7_9AGAM|nr:hypothetical protein BD410DRAFT_790344 [Rickenella mellea]